MERLGDMPAQRAIENKPVLWESSLGTVVALADYALTAEVMGYERYRFDRLADLSPVDLAMVWGPAALSEAPSISKVRQGNRWFWVRFTREPSLPSEVLMHGMANVHMVPASLEVRDALLEVDEGDVVALRGKLVELTLPDGSSARSSLSRKDTGAGACEIFWVTHLRVLSPAEVERARRTPSGQKG